MDVTFRNAHELVDEKVDKLVEDEKFTTKEMAGWVGKSTGRVRTALKRLEERGELDKEWGKNLRIWKVK